MNLRVQLVAPGGKHIRHFGHAWTANRTFTSLYDFRAWLWAVRMNLVIELTQDEPFFLAIAHEGGGKPVLILEVAREWPHAITDGIAIRRTNERTQEASG